MLRAKLSVENSCCGVSNEPVVSRLTWPENGVSAKKLVASRAGDPNARLMNPPAPNEPSSLGRPAKSSSVTVASFRMPRRA